MSWKSFGVIFIITVILLQSSIASEEKYGAEFLQQLTAADADGMGESLVAYSTGVRSINNNPAGLTLIKGGELLISAHRLPSINAVIMRENDDGKWQDYNKYNIKPTEMGLISYALPIGKFGNMGMSFIFHYGGRFIRVNTEGKAVNSFPQDDLAFVIGYSRRIVQNVSLGFDLKSIRSKLSVDGKDNIGRTYALNAGFLHQIGTRFKIGAVIQNIGNDLSFNSQEIPSELRKKLIIGAMYVVKDSKNSVLSLSMDMNPPFESGPRYNLGAELLYIRHLILRAGYIRSTDTYYESLLNLDDGSTTYEQRDWIRKGPTIGVGVRFNGVELNFASIPSREPILENDEKLRLENSRFITSFSFIVKF